jgi:hypothetical protein
MEAGTHSVRLPTLSAPSYAVLTVTMRNQFGQLFSDHVFVAFHVHFYRAVKYLILAPLGAAALLFLFLMNANELLMKLPDRIK